MAEIVKYDNFMNSLSLGGLQSRELNVLMALCKNFKEKGTSQMTLTFAELRTLIDDHQSTNEQLFEMLRSMNRKLLDITCQIETEDELIQFVLFTDFRTNKNFDYYKVGVNEKFSFVLNELSAHFTAFELSEFVRLKSKYSKNLYRLLKQFDSSCWRRFEADDLREKLGCPKSYKNNIFVRDILTPCVDELRSIFTDLTLDITKARRRGAPITGYEFRWRGCVNDDLPGQQSLDLSADVKQTNEKKTKTKTKTKFHNFEGRTYDFEKLEAEASDDVGLLRDN